jgi:RNA polymerase-interacting CarD/CdnL/TRCF family regulator
MSFKLGDKVIHSSYGLGEIVDLQEQIIQDVPKNCYVVKTSSLLIWVPVESEEQHSLRLPTVAGEFKDLTVILKGPPEPLPTDRTLRRNMLIDLLRDGHLASICRVIRDMAGYKKNTKLNDQEHSILDRAINSLLTEWTYSLGVPLQEARQEMNTLLEG